jgi:TPR repeat
MSNSDIVICQCGQWNRLPSDKSLKFSCQKCGKPLLYSVSNNSSRVPQSGRELRRKVAGGILLIIIIGALIFLGQLAAPTTQSSGRSVSKQNPPTASAVVAPSPHDREVRQRTVVREIPASAADESPPAAQPTESSSKVAQPTNNALGVELILPAPGCPEKVPTYKSVSMMCQSLEEKACSSNQLCRWSKASCNPAHRTYVPIADPAELARLGVGSPADVGVFTTVEAGRYVSKGDTYADTGQFDKAIVEYTRALKALPDDTPALAARALAYEKKGDKTRAITDYCKLIVATLSYYQRKSAVEAIARLTGEQRPGTLPTASRSLPSTNVPTNVQPVTPPPTGTIDKGRRRDRIAPLTIETEAGANYLIKFVNTGNDKDQIMIFVKGGETYSTKMPLGGYRIRAATGQTWYGRNDLFGPDTQFFRLQGKKGSAVDESPIFQFRKEGNTIHGMKLSLKRVIGGNMEQEKISRSEF